jgi:hypothetical protein
MGGRQPIERRVRGGRVLRAGRRRRRDAQRLGTVSVPARRVPLPVVGILWEKVRLSQLCSEKNIIKVTDTST